MARLAALVLVVTCGCSFVAVRSAPRGPERACAGYLPVIVDAAITAAFIGLAVRSAAERDCGPDGCHTYDPTGLYVLPALPFAVSTGWGVIANSTCKAAARH